jgi:hypothetical protein
VPEEKINVKKHSGFVVVSIGFGRVVIVIF